MKYKEWTQEMYNEIVHLHEKDGWGFEELGKYFETSTENARAAYRRAIGAKHSSYAGREADGTRKTYEQSDKFINVVCSSDRVMSEEDLIRIFNIDTDIWEIEKFIVKTSEGYRKDKTTDWHVSGGLVTEGHSVDSGKMLVTPLFHVRAQFKKLVKESQAKSAIENWMEDASKFSPVYPSINYVYKPDGCLGEIDMFDVHFGRLTWDAETGQSYDIKIAEKAVLSALNKALALMSRFPVNKILLPLGNDFFNVDSKFNTTTNGTPQQEDTRWQKTFRAGREVLVKMIDLCATVAPVDVLIIPGNHDEQRSYYLGEALLGWYRNCPNVTIDNSPAKRKYYKFGTNLIGYAHGYSDPLKKLPLIMALEKPQDWADTTVREWHTGDKHHKEDWQARASEKDGLGVMVRILRALCADDAWTVGQGFYGTPHNAEAFIWHPKDGLLAQLTAKPEKFTE